MLGHVPAPSSIIKHRSQRTTMTLIMMLSAHSYNIYVQSLNIEELRKKRDISSITQHMHILSLTLSPIMAMDGGCLNTNKQKKGEEKNELCERSQSIQQCAHVMFACQWFEQNEFRDCIIFIKWTCSTPICVCVHLSINKKSLEHPKKIYCFVRKMFMEDMLGRNIYHIYNYNLCTMYIELQCEADTRWLY